MIKRFPAQRVLELKIGAQVMLVKNDHDRDLFNGSVGIVKDFSDQYPRVVFGHASGCLREFVIEPVSFSVENAKGETLACRYQVPLIRPSDLLGRLSYICWEAHSKPPPLSRLGRHHT